MVEFVACAGVEMTLADFTTKDCDYDQQFLQPTAGSGKVVAIRG